MQKIEFIPLKYIEDDRGAVLHYLRNTDCLIDSFGECYFSWVNPSYIKGWYRHTRLVSCITSPTTNLKVALFDVRVCTTVVLIDINYTNYGLIKIPTGTWYSFKSADGKPALIVNMLNGTYDQNESERLPIDTPEIPYDWSTSV